MHKSLITAVYPVQIEVITSTKETLAYFRGIGMDEPEDLAFSDAFVQPLIGQCTSGAETQFLLLSFSSLRIARDPSILVHEMTHIKSFICEFLGLRCDTDNDEWEAYFQQYLFQLITDVVNNKHRPELFEHITMNAE